MQGGLYSETDIVKKEQRAYTKIPTLLRYSASDIKHKHDLDKVYGTFAL